MSRSMRLAVVVGVAAVLYAVPSTSLASPRPKQQPSRNDGTAISPGEVQRMFDAYALMRAEEQLSLRDDQAASFLSRFKALQDARRARVQEHARLVQELRMLLQADPVDDGQLRAKMKTMADQEARSAADVQRTYDALDQMLDVRQQARFRLFEEQMERRKLELLMRARQSRQLETPRP